MRKNVPPLLEAFSLHTSEPRDVALEEPVDVGARLRTLREARRLSIKALAEASGLAVNTLSLIEHGKSSPSVSTLQQLAAALRVPITAFFTPEAPRSRVVYHRAGEVATTPFPHGALADLGVGIARRSLEPLLLTLDPGAGSGSEPIIHAGQEFVYGLEGRIVYTVADEEYLIEPGASLLFEAALPHGWQNPGAARAVALLVLCPYEAPGSPSAHQSR
ncbi:MAG: cupin domain-containing protein [Chloroflexales bacterium]|nr:cupin domain-containing protein [Chloroflexales bacterium]